MALDAGEPGMLPSEGTPQETFNASLTHRGVWAATGKEHQCFVSTNLAQTWQECGLVAPPNGTGVGIVALGFMNGTWMLGGDSVEHWFATGTLSPAKGLLEWTHGTTAWQGGEASEYPMRLQHVYGNCLSDGSPVWFVGANRNDPSGEFSDATLGMSVDGGHTWKGLFQPNRRRKSVGGIMGN